jgi:hypothetical protein
MEQIERPYFISKYFDYSIGLHRLSSYLYAGSAVSYTEEIATEPSQTR